MLPTFVKCCKFIWCCLYLIRLFTLLVGLPISTIARSTHIMTEFNFMIHIIISVPSNGLPPTFYLNKCISFFIVYFIARLLNMFSKQLILETSLILLALISSMWFTMFWIDLVLIRNFCCLLQCDKLFKPRKKWGINMGKSLYLQEVQQSWILCVHKNLKDKAIQCKKNVKFFIRIGLFHISFHFPQ